MQRVSGDMFTVEGGGAHPSPTTRPPVELLGMEVLDEIIGAELDALRDQIREDGIMSLLK